ncbi:MAG: hypothetical protein ACJAWQ_000984 [Paraglaciecola sp.]|jgi:hypothetical protein
MTVNVFRFNEAFYLCRGVIDLYANDDNKTAL